MKRSAGILLMGFILMFLWMGIKVYAQETAGSRADVEAALDSIEQNQASDAPQAPAQNASNKTLALPEGRQAKEGQQVKKEEVPQDNAPEPIILDVLELKDMDINDVLKLISKKSGVNIVKGNNVRGKVTIYLKNVDLRDALRIILESNDLAYAEEGGIFRVMTAKDYEQTYGRKFGEKTEIRIIQLKNASAADILPLLTQIKSVVGKVIADEKSNTLVLIDIPEKLDSMGNLIDEIDVPLETKVFDLSYAKAEDIAKKVEESLTANVGNVKFDTRSNKIVVTDTPKQLEHISKLVQAFDEKHREVLIEAKIVQVILSDQYKMGIDWEAIVSNFHTLKFASDFDVLDSADKSGQLSIGTISNDDYTVLMEALDAIGTTNVLSSPSITVIDKEEAKILVGSTEPYVTTTTTTPATGATTTAESVSFIEVGVKLYVTPTIHNDDYITMKIKPEVSSVTRFLTTSNNNTIPVVDSSEAETTVTVKDGVTIVIGGLIKDEKIKTVKKVPLLGDIPFLGTAFRNKDKLLRKTETIIFLTPKIVTGDIADSALRPPVS